VTLLARYSSGYQVLMGRHTLPKDPSPTSSMSRYSPTKSGIFFYSSDKIRDGNLPTNRSTVRAQILDLHQFKYNGLLEVADDHSQKPSHTAAAICDWGKQIMHRLLA
jgi:hypothetical protein